MYDVARRSIGMSVCLRGALDACAAAFAVPFGGAGGTASGCGASSSLCPRVRNPFTASAARRKGLGLFDESAELRPMLEAPYECAIRTHGCSAIPMLNTVIRTTKFCCQPKKSQSLRFSKREVSTGLRCWAIERPASPDPATALRLPDFATFRRCELRSADANRRHRTRAARLPP